MLKRASGSGTSSSSITPIWDYDIPSTPILADIVVDGREIKAIAQPSKQGWLYVFDRQTGEPGLADRGTTGAGG